MSGKTFSYQGGFDDFVRAMLPEIDQPQRRKSVGVGDSMLRELEEFINRFCVTATNDDGDIVFDAAGTYTFAGDVVVNGALDVNGSLSIDGDTQLNANLSVGTDALKFDADGNMWWGSSSTFSGASTKISSAGVVTLTSGTFSGAITGGSIDINSGTFEVTSAGALTASNADIEGTISGSDITGGTVTGAEIRTSSSGSRVVMSNSDDIKFYNSSGTQTFSMDGNAGAGNSMLMSASNGRDVFLQTFSSGTAGDVFIQNNSISGNPKVRLSGGRNGSHKAVLELTSASSSSHFARLYGQAAFSSGWESQMFQLRNDDSGKSTQIGFSMRDARTNNAVIVRQSNTVGNGNRILVRNSNDTNWGTLQAIISNQSSLRYKTNVRPLGSLLSEYRSLPASDDYSHPQWRRILHGVQPYAYDIGSRETVGFGAEQFAEYVPEAVEYGTPENPDDRLDGETDDSMVPMGFISDAPSAVLWALTQQMDEALRGEIDDLRAKVAALGVVR